MMVVGSTIHAKIRGNWIYDVNIGTDGHTITHMDCTCPYAEDRSYCKHMAAVFYEYERRQTDILVQPSESTLTPKQLDYRKIINDADPKLVHSFLIDVLKANNDLTLDFLSRIHYGYNHENLSIITDSIDRLIRCVDYYHDGIVMKRSKITLHLEKNAWT